MMVDNQAIIIHRAGHKKGRRHDYNICRYTNNHPVTPYHVVNALDPGYLGIGNDFPEQLSSVPNKKKPSTELSRGKRVQPESPCKENNNRAYYHLQVKKALDNYRGGVQKQVEQAQ